MCSYFDRLCAIQISGEMEQELIPILIAIASCIISVWILKRWFSERPELTKDPQSFRLIKKKWLSLDKVVELTFATNDPKQALNLPTGAHIRFHTILPDGKEIKRSYTPTVYRTPGSFKCVIRTYPDGKMGNAIRKWKENDMVQISGPTGHLEYESGKLTSKIGKKEIVTDVRHMCLCCGGTGLTPMYQVLTHIKNDENDHTKVTILIAQSTVEDCLLMDDLEKLNEDPRFDVHYTVSRPDESWKLRGGRYHCGRINAEMFREVFGKFSEGMVAGVCGPPKFEKTSKQLFTDSDFPKVRMRRW